jgi:hypothetical protein
MPAETRGSVYKTLGGYGIRWPEDGKRQFKSGFASKTDARRWFNDIVAPSLRRGAPNPELRFDEFCDVFLARHVARERTKRGNGLPAGDTRSVRLAIALRSGRGVPDNPRGSLNTSQFEVDQEACFALVHRTGLRQETDDLSLKGLCLEAPDPPIR